MTMHTNITVNNCVKYVVMIVNTNVCVCFVVIHYLHPNINFVSVFVTTAMAITTGTMIIIAFHHLHAVAVVSFPTV